jgi:hypothetical protein
MGALAFGLFFLFLLFEGIGRFASSHMAELLLAKRLLLGFFLTEVGFGASSLSILGCAFLRHHCLLSYRYEY